MCYEKRRHRLKPRSNELYKVQWSNVCASDAADLLDEPQCQVLFKHSKCRCNGVRAEEQTVTCVMHKLDDLHNDSMPAAASR